MRTWRHPSRAHSSCGSPRGLPAALQAWALPLSVPGHVLYSARHSPPRALAACSQLLRLCPRIWEVAFPFLEPNAGQGAVFLMSFSPPHSVREYCRVSNEPGAMQTVRSGTRLTQQLSVLLFFTFLLFSEGSKMARAEVRGRQPPCQPHPMWWAAVTGCPWPFPFKGFFIFIFYT